ncbi:putative oxidoreductase [Catalinimonas alkaloidigena]|uniref:Putative oxidoreductase n=1 Tax=Catalinimonas alkaloidigena TaxID=1075417 RepID=A0A1G9KB13_9BACT|nr:DoxX family protein [Catalinimonas alkaloidigena]SDL47120.1 putative oxidoreductase [Catalinimonas alkaloidigena]
MSKLFSTKHDSNNLDIATLLLRVFPAGFMLSHGYPKFMKVLEGNFEFGDPLGLGPAASLILAAFAEFICSLLVILGLGTRLAVIPLIITMLTAAFIAHGDDPFGRKELSLLYLVVFVVLFLTGSGRFSVDSALASKRR